MSLFKAPVTVIGKLEILQRNFLSDVLMGMEHPWVVMQLCSACSGC